MSILLRCLRGLDAWHESRETGRTGGRKIFWPRRGVRLKAGAAKFSLWYILLLALFRITSPHRQRRAHLWRRVHALRSHQHRGGVGGGGALLSGWWR